MGRKGVYDDTPERQIVRAICDDLADLEARYGGTSFFMVHTSERRGVLCVHVGWTDNEHGVGVAGLKESISLEWPNATPCSLPALMSTLAFKLRGQILAVGFGTLEPPTR